MISRDAYAVVVDMCAAIYKGYTCCTRNVCVIVGDACYYSATVGDTCATVGDVCATVAY